MGDREKYIENKIFAKKQRLGNSILLFCVFIKRDRVQKIEVANTLLMQRNL